MTPALVLLVARKGVIVFHEAIGLVHELVLPPLPRDAIYPIASISKLFTATAVMILVDDGVLRTESADPGIPTRVRRRWQGSRDGSPPPNPYVRTS